MCLSPHTQAIYANLNRAHVNLWFVDLGGSNVQCGGAPRLKSLDMVYICMPHNVNLIPAQLHSVAARFQPRKDAPSGTFFSPPRSGFELSQGRGWVDGFFSRPLEVTSAA